MNLKKIMLIFSLPLLFAFKSNSMQSQRPRQSTDICDKLVRVLDKTMPWINPIDYLVQLASIYSIDSKNEKVVAHLPKARILMNLFPISFTTSLLLKYGIETEMILPVGCASARSYNIFRDCKIWNNANLIASKNGKRIDTVPANKKRSHYIWLTINKLLPLLAYKFGDSGMNLYDLSNLVTNFSELYRQKLMYDLIENKQK